MEEYNGFGIERADLQELQKALAVGYGTSPETQTGFGATRLESLEKTLKYATAKEKTATFWKALKKGKGNSTVEEFTQVNNIGSANFYVEGGLPEEFDEDLSREFEQTKYIGAVGKVPLVATQVKSQVNNEALVQRLKAIAIIRESDVKSFFGNSANISVEWNGFLAQFINRVKDPDLNIIDLEGKVLTPEVLSDVALRIQENYGDPNNIKGWIEPKAFNNYAKHLIANKQFFVNSQGVRDITAVPRTFELGDGSGKLETDLFLRHKGESYLDARHPKLNSAKTAFAAVTTKAPAVLDGTTFTVTATGNTSSKLAPGTYDYCVVPVNKYGAGQGFEVTGNVLIADQDFVFAISDNGSPSGQEAESFEIYRKLSSQTSLTDYRYVKTIPAGATTKKDDGSEIPETTFGFFFDWDFDQVLDFKQLLPMVKMPLATIDDSKRWLQKLYGTPILYNPNKMVLVKNIGNLSW